MREEKWNNLSRLGAGAAPEERIEAHTTFRKAVQSHEECEAGLKEFDPDGPRDKAIEAERAKVNQAEADLAKAQERTEIGSPSEEQCRAYQ